MSLLDLTATVGAVDAARASFLRDVKDGLSRPQKSLSPKYFYDARGSELFEAICRTPEYYPTRTETALLARVARELAPRIPAGAALVEFGSGASDKTQLLLDAAPQLGAYVPIDISAAALAPAAQRIGERYPNLRVQPIEADFTRPMHRAELEFATATLGFFPGSTIGNFTRAEASAFLSASHDLLGGQAQFLLGADLLKDVETLERAYDDAQGVTAAFNLNLLRRINLELDADFELDRFAHRAIWNDGERRIEMHLESLTDQTVSVGGADFAFRRGETLHTENSHKFTPDDITGLGADSGWRVGQSWISEANAFGEFLLQPI